MSDWLGRTTLEDALHASSCWPAQQRAGGACVSEVRNIYDRYEAANNYTWASGQGLLTEPGAGAGYPLISRRWR